jgi:hypothetical protein
MASPTPTDLTPEQWRDRLLTDVQDKAPRLQRIRDYLDGNHELAFVSTKWRAAFGDLLEEMQDNWLATLIDVVVQRLTIQGFQPDEGDAAGDPDAPEGGSPYDHESQDIWEENDLDIGSDELNEDALAFGRGYALVAPPYDEDDDIATVTVEDPLCCSVATDPTNPRRRLAGLKVWTDLDGHGRCTLYLPDEVWRWRTDDEVDTAGLGPETTWLPVDDEPQENPSGVVQLVPVDNRRGRSEIEQFIPAQDAINKLMADMLVGSEYVAFPQRVLTGVELPETDAEQDKEEIKAAISRLWAFENGDVKVQEFSAADLTAFTKAIETIVQHVASRSQTPPHYLLGSGSVFPSGESLKGVEVSLVAKTRRAMRALGVGYREIIRTAKLMVSDGDQKVIGRKPIWGDPEYRSEGERVDALVKLRALGLPLQVVWLRWGASPQEVEKWTAMARDEAAIAGLTLGQAPTGAPLDDAGFDDAPTDDAELVAA